jgi:hypothetical protein
MAGKEAGRDVIGRLKRLALVDGISRASEPGAPFFMLGAFCSGDLGANGGNPRGAGPPELTPTELLTVTGSTNSPRKTFTTNSMATLGAYGLRSVRPGTAVTPRKGGTT